MPDWYMSPGAWRNHPTDPDKRWRRLWEDEGDWHGRPAGRVSVRVLPCADLATIRAALCLVFGLLSPQDRMFTEETYAAALALLPAERRGSDAQG